MFKFKSRYSKIIEALQSLNLDMTQRSIPFDEGTIDIIYIKQLTDRASLSELVVKPLVLHFNTTSDDTKTTKAIDIMNRIIYADDCEIESDENKIKDYILTGMTVILLSTDPQYIVINLKKVEHRAVSSPEIQYTLRGPRDCFVENLDVNISLIRYRVKDENLRIKTFEVGKRTKAKVAVFYIEDVANNTVVNEIQKRIEQIDIDGIGESGELQAFLLNKKSNLFPQMGLIERSDMAFHSLLEGKVMTIIDGSGIALIAPRVFTEFFHSCDDRYDNKYFGLFMRMIRYLAAFIAVTASSHFVAITSFHTSALPGQYAILLAQMRAKVPFSALTGALLLEFIVELLRESLLRVPKQIGSAVGIVGAIVIGQAAISAGVFSPLLLILISASFLASFAIPDFSIMNPLRLLKFIALIFTGTLGFYGLVLFYCLMLINLVSINSFDTPYLAPLAPFKWYDFVRSFIFNISISPKRPEYLRTKDKNRGKT